MTARLTIAMLLMPLAAQADPAAEPVVKSWREGDHLTGNWGGKRDWLADHGVTIDLVYATETFTTFRDNPTLLGHIDAALTLDTEKLGGWAGGKFYGLVQDGRGHGIDRYVGSATQVSNLEADPYTQLTELFYEHHLFDDKLRIRIGKQDANREFGTPRFGGNFINNNFGMFPNSPLPSYPTTGLGGVIVVEPIEGLAAKAGIYEGNPQVGGLGLDTAFQKDGGHTLVGGLAATRHFGPGDRNGGTTSIGVWHQTGQFTEVDAQEPHMFGVDDGFFVQHDERIYAHPEDPNNTSDLNVILRFSWARPDRTAVSRYLGGSAAWHGLGARDNDTVGIGFGYFTIAEPAGGSIGPGDEWFLEAFYKLRYTSFISLQPDVQFYRHPGGDGRDAVIAGARLKVKL